MREPAGIVRVPRVSICAYVRDPAVFPATPCVSLILTDSSYELFPFLRPFVFRCASREACCSVACCSVTLSRRRAPLL